MTDSDVSRRAAIKAAIKGAAYAAPVILAATIPSAVSAQAVSGAPAAGLTMTAVIVGSTTVSNGGTITLLVTATNNGPSTSPSTTGLEGFSGPGITEAGPVITLVSASVSQGVYGGTPTPIGFAYTGPEHHAAPGLAWSIGDLAAGTSATLTLVVRVTAITAPTVIEYENTLFGTAVTIGRVTFTATP